MSGLKAFPKGPMEFGLQKYLGIAQSAFSGTFDVPSDTWATDGWCTEPVQYDFSASRVPFFSQYVENDTTCSEVANEEYLDVVLGDNQISSVVWEDGREHGGPKSSAGDNDDIFFNQVLAHLLPAEAAEIDC